jgi:ABC-type amino acid transport substrate-binding protein
MSRRQFVGIASGTLAATGLALAGCGSSQSSSSSDSSSGFSKSSYTVATDTTFAPFEFTDASGNFVGIDVDILAKAAELTGFKYELNSLGFDAAGRSPRIQPGRCCHRRHVDHRCPQAEV